MSIDNQRNVEMSNVVITTNLHIVKRCHVFYTNDNIIIKNMRYYINKCMKCNIIIFI